MCDRREDLAHLVLMLCGLAAVLQASGFDGVAFDPFSFQQDGLAVPEVDVGRGEVTDALDGPFAGFSGQVIGVTQNGRVAAVTISVGDVRASRERA